MWLSSKRAAQSEVGDALNVYLLFKDILLFVFMSVVILDGARVSSHRSLLKSRRMWRFVLEIFSWVWGRQVQYLSCDAGERLFWLLVSCRKLRAIVRSRI